MAHYPKLNALTLNQARLLRRALRKLRLVEMENWQTFDKADREDVEYLLMQLGEET